MIRFFRQLRQRLLTENRVSKYLLYAVGEIVLVVVGILLALQINTWNQERLDRAEEQKYLLRLEQDLQLDLARLELVRENYERRLVYALGILDSLPGSNAGYVREWEHYEAVVAHFDEKNRLEARSVGEDLLAILSIEHFRPVEVTFEELLSTGKINILQDDSLKISLQYHYPILEEADRFQEVIVMEIQRNFRNMLNDLRISYYSHDDHPGVFRDPESATKLRVALENYLRTTTVMLNRFYYDPDSAYHLTATLLKRLQAQLGAP